MPFHEFFFNKCCVKSMFSLQIRQWAFPTTRKSAITQFAMADSEKVITLDTLNPRIKVMEYAVRGPIVARAAEIEKELAKVRVKLFQLSCV